MRISGDIRWEICLKWMHSDVFWWRIRSVRVEYDERTWSEPVGSFPTLSVLESCCKVSYENPVGSDSVVSGTAVCSRCNRMSDEGGFKRFRPAVQWSWVLVLFVVFYQSLTHLNSILEVFFMKKVIFQWQLFSDSSVCCCRASRYNSSNTCLLLTS